MYLFVVLHLIFRPQHFFMYLYVVLHRISPPHICSPSRIFPYISIEYLPLQFMQNTYLTNFIEYLLLWIINHNSLKFYQISPPKNIFSSIFLIYPISSPPQICSKCLISHIFWRISSPSQQIKCNIFSPENLFFCAYGYATSISHIKIFFIQTERYAISILTTFPYLIPYLCNQQHKF